MDDNFEIDKLIHRAAECAASVDDLSVTAIERFLRSGESYSAASYGLCTRASVQLDGAYGRAEAVALRTLFDYLVELLPAEARFTEPVGRETIRTRIEPMVRGLVRDEWQEVALRELTTRTFVLNVPGARAGLEAELSTGYTRTARNVVWASFEDYGLGQGATTVGFDGVSGGSYAHSRLAAYNSKDPYGDVVVHEAAHLLHYLRPELFGLPAPKGKERFVNVDFHHRELFAYACEAYTCEVRRESRASRIQFAERMAKHAFSFPDDQIGPISDLVLAAARARNGWRTICDATVIATRRGRTMSPTTQRAE